MPNETATELQQVAHAIGHNVRDRRTARSWTLDDLAERSGVSRRMLVQIEQGRTNPSIGVLLRLSEAFGTGLPQLVSREEPPEVDVVAAGRAPILWTGDHGGRARLVSSTPPPHVVELWDWEMRPGEVHASEPHSAGTRELLLVGSGRLLLVVGDTERVLAPGDAAGFAGDQWHRYQAAPGSRSGVRFTLTVFQPDVTKPTYAR